MVALAFILLALWLIGVLSAYTVGGLIHLLLVIGVIILIIRLLRSATPAP